MKPTVIEGAANKLRPAAEPRTDNPNPYKRADRRYQLHLWISEQEYVFLKTLSDEEDEPMATTIRRMIRQWRRTLAKNRGDAA
jgi:hypothetical protein